MSIYALKAIFLFLGKPIYPKLFTLLIPLKHLYHTNWVNGRASLLEINVSLREYWFKKFL
ncbi:hypothetical protein DCMF_11125 [Candidatus Formimonas warabiya]|uniref:Uncharacterized protein n=1 Tax=Formimonas warabiya TaxID=1761012 RepID=A0A3G1KS22_FORW1|nr:hypothetical protein DCMF_11125 [Candidatus Formimonas warabiya]